MRIRVIGLLSVVAIVLSVSLARAQEAATWYWAVNEAKGQLLAYTADGQVNTLIDGGVTGDGSKGWRFGADSALVDLTTNEERSLYHLKSDSVQQIRFAADSKAAPSSQILVVQNASYAVMMSNLFTYETPLLINLSTNTAEWLTGKMILRSGVPDILATFSADGKYLRYVSQKAGQTLPATILERTLNTGEERTIAEVAFVFTLSRDRYGENWVYSYGKKTTFISASGQTRTQDEINGTFPVMFGDYLVFYDRDCMTNCSITRQALNGDSSLTFTIPAEALFNILAAPDRTHLLILDNATYWLLGADGTAQQIGEYVEGGFVTTPPESVSPDGRWVLSLTEWTSVADSPIKYVVWDNLANKPIMQNDLARDVYSVQIHYGAGGFVVGEDAKHFRLYRASDGKVVELPNIEQIVYYDVLADGTVLCALNQASDVGGKGIYRYDPAANTFKLLVADAQPLTVQ